MTIVDQNFFSRDISWLYFNQRVLDEAGNRAIPVGERLKFLSIFSSNLDEFYRVRIPVLAAKQQFSAIKNNNKINHETVVSEFVDARQLINQQQQQFGQTLVTQLIPLLAEQQITWFYNQPITDELKSSVGEYFFSTIAAFLQPVYLDTENSFFPENNKLYLFISLEDKNVEKLVVLNIPSDQISRFYKISKSSGQYIFFIDDIIRQFLPYLFSGKKITGCYSFKINRDAELNLEDELPESLAEKIEKQVAKRDAGLATRLLHPPDLPLRHLQLLCNLFKTSISNAMSGGTYHNLKDIADFPLSNSVLFFRKQSPLRLRSLHTITSLFNKIENKDIILHPPYNSYTTVLRFFNEAAVDESVDEIYATLYRIANNSMIAHALISAAKNGKKVQVFVELKARFDEANNIRWAKKMKDAGVKVTYSIPKLKVHAKIALVKKRNGRDVRYYGLLATGNMNETTARFYTDHILLTADQRILREMELLFVFLTERRKPQKEDNLPFKHLLVAQFNLQQQFISFIDKEIENAKQGLSAAIYIKLNNLEERVLINKLYEASNAGVKVQLIVRSICCLVPGVKGLSENISIKRIVNRYLEHGRVFIFHNGGDIQVLMGSADWMNRNIYTRIEVCFPIYDADIKNEMQEIMALHLKDNVQAVWIDSQLHNVPVEKQNHELSIDAQQAIYELLTKNNDLLND